MIPLLSSVLVLVSVFFLVILEVVRRRSRRWQLLKQFPGDTPLPLIGNGLALGFDSDDATVKLMDMWKKYGKTNFRVTVGADDWVMLSEPEDVEVLLSSSSELIKATKRNVAMKPFFGNSVGAAEGEKWLTARKLVTPGFSYKFLEAQLDIINDYFGELKEKLSQYDGKNIHLYRYFKPFFFDIGCKSLTGADYSFFDKHIDDPYVVKSNKLVEMVTRSYFSYFNHWQYFPALYRLTSLGQEEERIVTNIRKMSTKMINDRRRKLKSQMKDSVEDSPGVKCVLDVLLLSKSSDEVPIQDDIINDEISFMCFTTMHLLTLTVSHALYCIAKHPEIQDKLLEEQKNVLGTDFRSRKATLILLNEMTYLDAVLKETMRLIPSVTLMGRHLQNDLVLSDGRVIPASTNVLVHSQGLCQNERVFEDPDKFIPERFFNKNLHSYAFVPFGSGRRACIGSRFAWVAMKATLSNILRQFQFSVTPQSEPQFVYRILTESRNGIQLHLKTRDFA